MQRLLLLVLLGGCDKLFDIDAITLGDGRGSGTSDVLGVDVPQGLCPVGPPDEDGDSLRDDCDRCPTIMSDATDTDGDGLPNACDFDLGINDRDQILFAATFDSSTDLSSNFTSTNVTYSPFDGGQLMFGAGGATLTMLAPVVPTRIEVMMTGISGNGLSAEAVIRGPVGIYCHVRGAGCTGTADETCDEIEGGSTATLVAPIALVRAVTLFTDDNDNTNCLVKMPSLSAAATIGGRLSGGNVQLTTSSAASTLINSIVIYGSK